MVRPRPKYVQESEESSEKYSSSNANSESSSDVESKEVTQKGNQTNTANKFKKEAQPPLKLTLTRKKRNTIHQSSDGNESSSGEEFQTIAPRAKRRQCVISNSNSSESQSELTASENEENSPSSESEKVIKVNGRKRKRRFADEDSSNKGKKSRLRGKKYKTVRERNEESPRKESKNRRKEIRHVLKRNQLTEETKDAEKQEKERRRRLQNRKDDKIVEVDEGDDVPVPVTKRLVLQKEPLVEVHPHITVYLKPHQVEGIQFIWDNLIETTEQAQKEEGGGCILAHCMGLGKTLQTISVMNTVLTTEHLSLKTVLVVAPLNTLINWINELHHWLPPDSDLQLYNLHEYAVTRDRFKVMQKWSNHGGIMVMGYDMFRILASGIRIKYKKFREGIKNFLLDPGPDVVVCDEGHRLKNSESNISLIMSKIRTKRRLVLTGTPLQNNLMEYQCMVNFVKPNLLGSVKEFRNRFMNPIQNGQHSDSTPYDVRLMKKRCHILHNMLQGFVQRKDYTALAQYLCEKMEYIVKVRLSPLQIKLYRHYLDTQTNRGSNPNAVTMGSKDTGLFADYQNLMRIWTHPRVLQLHSIRQDHMNQFLNDETSEDEAINTSDEDKEWKSEEEEKNDKKCETPLENGAVLLKDSDEEATRKKPSRATRKKRILDSENESSSSSSEEEEEEPDYNEEEEESSGSVEKVVKRKRKGGRYTLRGANLDDTDNVEHNEKDVEEPEGPEHSSWYSSILKEHCDNIMEPDMGGKLAVLFEILRLAQDADDKVLVFSQSLLSLDLIEEMLSRSTIKAIEAEGTEDGENEQETDPSFQKWYKNIDYFRMDGSSLGKSRQRWIDDFNDENDRRARLFLISTRAGSLGVNLVAANRVVIFDASWNPTHDIQSIFRVYRFGQTKSCFIYRLIAQGAMEEKIYDRQVTKQSLSFRVVDEQQINRHFTAHDLQELYTFNPSTPDENEEYKHALPKDKLLAELLVGPRTKNRIASYHTHDSLLDHQETEELTEEERKAAWEEFENEKKMGVINKPINTFKANIINANAAAAADGGKSLEEKFKHFNKLMTEQYLQRQRFLEEQQRRAADDHMNNLLPSTIQFTDIQRKQIQNISTLMIKVAEGLEKSASKARELDDINIQQTIDGLRTLPMYNAMKEESLKMLAIELQIKRRQQRLVAEKEHRQLSQQYDWLKLRYQTILTEASLAQAEQSQVQPDILRVPLNNASFSDSSSINESKKIVKAAFSDMLRNHGFSDNTKQQGSTSTDVRKNAPLNLVNKVDEEKPLSSTSAKSGSTVYNDDVINVDESDSSPVDDVKNEEVDANESSQVSEDVDGMKIEELVANESLEDPKDVDSEQVLIVSNTEDDVVVAKTSNFSDDSVNDAKMCVMKNLIIPLVDVKAKKKLAKSKKKQKKESSEEEAYNDSTDEEDWEASYLNNNKSRSTRTRSAR